MVDPAQPPTVTEPAMTIAEGAGRVVTEPGSEATAAVPDKLGRYVVVRLIGSGAMGAVYLSYDPELDRKLALKVIAGEGDAEHRHATLREAQAMARLSHPNVVTVHDVGEHGGAVYIAMEFIEGITLRQWIGEDERNWREVLDKFIAAGRGLEAAHARGLIHRDFKPDNAMVTGDGEVRVMDFGLARQEAARAAAPVVDASTSSDVRVGEATVGIIAGTPAYMAPEQARGGGLTAAVDQFAFCVSLWEALSGHRPFRGENLEELFANAAAGRFQGASSKAKLPGWLRTVLVRGLQPSAAKRWPSMTDLLAALQRGRRRWRWKLGLALVGAGVVAGGLVFAEREQQRREYASRLDACRAAGEAIERTWDAAATQRLRSGLLATGVPFAQQSAETLIPWLDDYAHAWAAGRTQVCLHQDIDRDWTPDQVDRSLWCLEDRQLQLEATVNQIATINADGARRAVRMASYLDPVEACMDPSRLEQLPAPPPDIRDEIRVVRATLSASDALRHAGRPEDALELAKQALERADTMAWPPLQALARFLAGRCSLEANHFEDSVGMLTAAYFQAVEARSLEVAFRAARSVASALAQSERSREAEDWMRHADMLFPEKRDPGRLDEAERDYLLAAVYLARKDYDAATRHAMQALELREAVLGEHHPITAAALGMISNILYEQGRYAEAIPYLERSLAVWEGTVGRDHRRVWVEETGLAYLLSKQGRAEEALPLIQHAQAGLEDGGARDTQHAKDARFVSKIVHKALGRAQEDAAPGDLLGAE